MSSVLSLSSVPRIELRGKRTPPALFAEAELRQYLKLILGETRTDESSTDNVTLILHNEPSISLSDEGYTWEADGNTIRITAGGDLGLVFGVYAFLRDVCGCRFCGLGPDGENVPRLKQLNVALTPTRCEPKLWYRSLQFYYFENPALYIQVVDWMAKNGFNYVLYHLGTEHDSALVKEQVDPQTGERLFPERRGPSMFDEDYFNRYLLPEIRKRGLKLDFNHHNLCYWLVPARNRSEHPEWFAEIDGKRGANLAQLCLCTSNRAAVEELIRRVKEFLRAHPGVRIVGVIPEDGRGMCQCDACRAEDVDPRDAFRTDDYRDPANENRSLTRRYARLLNDVARALRDEFPGVLVGGQAYIDHQWPPRDMELEDNITVQVAVYWRDGARSLAADGTSEHNRFFFDLIRQWRSKLKGPLLLYEYYMGMQAQRSLPYPMTEVIAKDWQELAQIPVEGASIQCCAGCHEAYALNLLAFSQCAWGERVDADRLLDDYVLSMFGNAGKVVHPIFRGLLDAMAAWPNEHTELLPDGKSIAWFWKQLGSERVAKTLARAREQASDDRERRQLQRLTAYLRYCELAARAVETRDATAIEAVIHYLETTKVPGWILPRAIARWRSDLAAVQRKLEAEKTHENKTPLVPVVTRVADAPARRHV